MSYRVRLREQLRYLAQKEREAAVKINIVGVGGCGNNAINNLSRLRLPAKLIAMNTDSAVLRRTRCDVRVLLGGLSAEARGARGVPELGAQAMEESIEEAIGAIDENVDVIIGIAGLGGGTGTGGLPVLFRELRTRRPNALRIAVVTLPFKEEGEERIRNAQIGLRELMDVSDAIIVNANDVLAERLRGVSMAYAFKEMDKRIARIVEALVRMQSPMIGPGVINVDFSNVQRLMQNSGFCFVGVGDGPRIYDAYIRALSDDYARSRLEGARGAILMFEGRETLLDMTQIRNTTRQFSERYAIPTVFMGLRPTWDIVDVRVSVFVTSVKCDYVEEFMSGFTG